MGTPGLAGMDKMLSHFVAVEMQKVVKFIDKGIKNKTWSSTLKECETLFQSGENLKSNLNSRLIFLNYLKDIS